MSQPPRWQSRWQSRWQPPRWQPPPAPAPPPPPPPRTVDACTEPAAKRSKAERTCSICKVSKSLHDSFSKSQRGKGAKAKCKKCIEGQQQSCEAEKREAREAKKKNKEEHQKRVAAARLKREEERKQRELKRKQEEEERERAARLKEDEDTKRLIAEYEEKEAHHYKQKKDAHERHLQKLNALGTTISKEMSTPSHFVYVVTSISKRGSAVEALDQFCYSRHIASETCKLSPHIHGIYTTCKKAQECARKVFESSSKTYRDGKFIPSEERIAKCDATDFLIPGVKFHSRVMFELFRRAIQLKVQPWEEPTLYEYDFTAIGINAIPLDANDVTQNLPFWERRCEYDHEEEEKSTVCDGDVLVPGGTSDLFAIFTHVPGQHDEDASEVSLCGTEVNLCGVFSNKESATEHCAEKRKDILKAQKRSSPEVSNGVKFYQLLHENCCAVAIEAVTLDHDYGGDTGKKLELGTEEGGCTWIDPAIDWY